MTAYARANSTARMHVHMPQRGGAEGQAADDKAPCVWPHRLEECTGNPPALARILASLGPASQT